MPHAFLTFLYFEILLVRNSFVYYDISRDTYHGFYKYSSDRYISYRIYLYQMA